MIAWILEGIAILIAFSGIIFIVATLKSSENNFSEDAAALVIMCTLLIICAVPPTATYYRDTISIPEDYRRINTTITETKELISCEELNLADMEMHKELASLIKEKQQLLAQVRINNRSPLAFYKIILPEK